MSKPVALVTGASRGIGASIARRLAKDGFHVFVNYSSNETKAREVVDQIVAEGGTADLCGFDVSNPTAVDEKIDAIAKSHGPLAVLVNNAGVTIDALLMRLKEEDLDKTLSIDLKGAIYC